MITCSICRVLAGVGKVIMRFDFAQPDLCALLNRVWHDAKNGRKAPEVANMEISSVVNMVRSAFAEKIMASECRYIRDFYGAQNRQYLAVMSAMAYINGHIGEKLFFDDLAKQAGYSSQHFARLSRQYCGYGFRDYIDQVRIGMFRNLYYVKNMPKNDIAIRLSFLSGSAFSRWLRNAQNKQTRRQLTAHVRRHGDKGTI